MCDIFPPGRYSLRVKNHTPGKGYGNPYHGFFGLVVCLNLLTRRRDKISLLYFLV
jgi:hypothetical protein